MGEKTRKNLPEVSSLTIRYTQPATPNPMRTNLKYYHQFEVRCPNVHYLDCQMNLLGSRCALFCHEMNALFYMILNIYIQAI